MDRDKEVKIGIKNEHDDLALSQYDNLLSDTHSEEEPKEWRIFCLPVSRIKWYKMCFMFVLHILAFYGYYHCIVSPVKALTMGFVHILCFCAAMGK